MHLLIVQLLDTYRGQCGIPQEIVVAVVDHILENHHAQLITLIVEFLRFYLDMLTQGVESQPLHF